MMKLLLLVASNLVAVAAQAYTVDTNLGCCRANGENPAEHSKIVFEAPDKETAGATCLEACMALDFEANVCSAFELTFKKDNRFACEVHTADINSVARATKSCKRATCTTYVPAPLEPAPPARHYPFSPFYGRQRDEKTQETEGVHHPVFNNMPQAPTNLPSDWDTNTTKGCIHSNATEVHNDSLPQLACWFGTEINGTYTPPVVPGPPVSYQWYVYSTQVATYLQNIAVNPELFFPSTIFGVSDSDKVSFALSNAIAHSNGYALIEAEADAVKKEVAAAGSKALAARDSEREYLAYVADQNREDEDVQERDDFIVVNRTIGISTDCRKLVGAVSSLFNLLDEEFELNETDLTDLLDVGQCLNTVTEKRNYEILGKFRQELVSDIEAMRRDILYTVLTGTGLLQQRNRQLRFNRLLFRTAGEHPFRRWIQRGGQNIKQRIMISSEYQFTDDEAEQFHETLQMLFEPSPYNFGTRHSPGDDFYYNYDYYNYDDYDGYQAGYYGDDETYGYTGYAERDIHLAQKRPNPLFSRFADSFKNAQGETEREFESPRETHPNYKGEGVPAIVQGGEIFVVLNGFSFTQVMRKGGEFRGTTWARASKDIVEKVQDLLERNVRIFMCQNTANTVGFTQQDLIPGIEIAPFGATVMIAQAQANGFQYIRA